ncbi:chemotaxis protein CheY [Microbacterium sp. SL62]|uniref:chemotaxis protein CheY n=1 Tax=Microbacterium sp. SL62 TaxID=2995139 RepID=UPI0022760569|nr:chemotaxis protein CheY [Microbacterium sp. SL62]MCY1718646.1 chemotaxis protein CheY [Microbacterium sp. SL62]
MTELVADAARRVLREKPDIEVCFTPAIRPDSFRQGATPLFLHPTHRQLIDELRSADG